MTTRVLLLWRPAPTTDALVRTLRGCPDVDDAARADVGDLAGRRRPRVRVGLARRLRRRTSWLRYVPVDGERDEAHRTVDAVADGLSSLPRRARPVLLLPSERHQLEQVYRDHVLGGGIDEFTPFRLREDLDGRVAAWREQVGRVVDDAGGRTVVATGDPDADVAALAEATGVDPEQLRARLEDPSGISARGLEVLRRMNGFTRGREERRTTRRFCRKTFPATEPAELEVPDGHVWPTP